MEFGAVAASVMKAPVVEFFTWTMNGTDDPVLNVAPALGLTNTAEPIGNRHAALRLRDATRRHTQKPKPLPGLRSLLFVFPQLATLHHRGRRGAGSDPG